MEYIFMAGTGLWVVCMIAAPIIAYKKNHSVWGWLFAGLFLGLIAVIILICLPPIKK